MQIILKKPHQIEGIRNSCRLAANCLKYIEEYVVPGVSTEELDDKINQYILDNGATSACLNYKGYPKHTCISLNEVICHGIPDQRKLKEGDILNIDVTTILNGYYGDTSKMYEVGQVSDEAKKVIEVSRKSLEIGISQVYPGNKTGRIGYEIARYAEKMGCGVVDFFCGHGVGIYFHEDPKIIHRCTEDNTGHVMVPRMIFTIEPMINYGTKDVMLDEADGWTARTADGGLSAQFEHTIMVTELGSEILTLPTI
jgi:methionyl aminopeptidase